MVRFCWSKRGPDLRALHDSNAVRGASQQVVSPEAFQQQVSPAAVSTTQGVEPTGRTPLLEYDSDKATLRVQTRDGRESVEVEVEVATSGRMGFKTVGQTGAQGRLVVDAQVLRNALEIRALSSDWFGSLDVADYKGAGDYVIILERASFYSGNVVSLGGRQLQTPRYFSYRRGIWSFCERSA